MVSGLVSRPLLVALVIAGACARPQVAAPPRTIARHEAPELLGLLDGVDLPSPLGWRRVERMVLQDHEGLPRCRYAWVQPGRARPIEIADELDIDWAGTWFATWPMHMRVAHDAYDDVEMPVRVAKANVLGANRRPLAERPSDLLLEVTVELDDRPRCTPLHPHDVTAAFARATWVRALGHDELAARMVERRPLDWSDELMRTRIADALIDVALDGLRQGMPRARARPLLAHARAICRGRSGDTAAALLAVLGDDPGGVPARDDPDALVAWLAEDLRFPQLRYDPDRLRDEVGWPADQGPRSPAFELIAIGWPALPALLDHGAPEKLLRRGRVVIAPDGTRSLPTTRSFVRRIVSVIAGRPFADDTAMRTWWTHAREHDELTAMIANLRDPDAYLAHSVGRIAAIAPARTIAVIEEVWPTLDERRRAGMMDALAREDPHALRGHERLVARALDSTSLAIVAPAAELARKAGMRGWIPPIIRRARRELARQWLRYEPDTADDPLPALLELLVTIVRADAHRGTALVRDALRMHRAVGPELATDVLALLCEPDDAARSRPPCSPALRRMYEAHAPADE